jgi:hypothetical protein
MRRLTRGLRVARVLSGVLPLLGAAVIVVEGPGLLQKAGGYPFPALVIAFMALSCGGFFVANMLTERALEIARHLQKALVIVGKV